MDLEHGSIATTKSWVGICLPCLPGSDTPEGKKWRCAPQLSYHLKSEVSMHLLSAMFNPLHSITNPESSSAIKVATMKNTDDFCYEGKPSRATTKSTLFTVSKDEWDTKEDTGKSTKNALYILRYAKRHVFTEVMSNSEKKTKPIALAVIELSLFKGISQSVSH